MPNRAWTYRSILYAARLPWRAMAVRSSQCAALLGILLTSQVAIAGPTFTVNSFLDQPDDLSTPGTCHTSANTCTLRAAIMQANRTSGVGATVVLPAGLYTLTIPASVVEGENNGDLDLTTPAFGNPVISIVGAGAATTLIDANQLDRVLRVDLGRTASISGVTIRNGYLPGYFGGGILNDGSLTLSNSTISGNRAFHGGGIASFVDTALTVVACTITQNTTLRAGAGIFSDGDLNVRDSTIEGNTTGEIAGGGGIFAGVDGEMTMLNSTVTGNHTGSSGGGIFNRGSMLLVSSTITQNTSGRDGAGIFSDSDLNIRNSTIKGNTAGEYGGGITTTLGLTMQNSTVSGNQAGLGAGGIINNGSMFLVSSTISQNSTNGNGGGLYNQGTANVYSTTIAFNGADADGNSIGVAGGVFNNGAAFNLRNTLVAGNETRAPFFVYFDDCAGTLTGFGANLFVAVLAGGCTVNGNWGTLNAVNTIGPLQDNGGPTRTHALLAGSNAIDGTVSGCVDFNSIPLTIDQRGAPRVSGLRCDIGAFEVPEPGLALMLGCGVLGVAAIGRMSRDNNSTTHTGQRFRRPATPIPAASA